MITTARQWLAEEGEGEERQAVAPPAESGRRKYYSATSRLTTTGSLALYYIEDRPRLANKRLIGRASTTLQLNHSLA